MTRLLVSVRDAPEARIALASGADLIDIKEPSLGSLGRASDEAITAVLHEVAGRKPVSVALGELRDWSACLAPSPGTPGEGTSPAPSLRFAKLGLAGCAAISDWPARWADALRSIVPPRGAVAVIYADWRAVEAPEPDAVLDQARRLGCGAVLLDTYNKRAGGLLQHWPLHQVAQLITAAHAAGMLAVVAGSLGFETIHQIASLSPDYVAVRGSVCRGGRAGPLDGELIEQLRERLQASRLLGCSGNGCATIRHKFRATRNA
jgi:uncharacterized protein (UPF0264 family)